MLLVDEQGKVSERVIEVDRAIGSNWLVSSGLAAGDRPDRRGPAEGPGWCHREADAGHHASSRSGCAGRAGCTDRSRQK